ncbi:hypothetical protein Ancab_023059, partial [Ancistrocladus abbreviatus]
MRKEAVLKNSIDEDDEQKLSSQTKKAEDSFKPSVRYNASTKHFAEAIQNWGKLNVAHKE